MNIGNTNYHINQTQNLLPGEQNTGETQLSTHVKPTTLAEYYYSKNKDLQEKLNTNIEKFPAEVRTRTRVKRYGLATVSALLTFIWFLPKTMKENPVFEHMFSDIKIKIVFDVVWCIVLLITFIYWLHISNRIKKEKLELNHIKIESVQNSLFNEFLKDLKKFGEAVFSKETFSKFIRKEIVHNLFGDKGVIKEKSGEGLITDVSQEAIQNVADIILLRAEEHEVIRKINKRSLEDYYEVIDA